MSNTLIIIYQNQSNHKINTKTLNTIDKIKNQNYYIRAHIAANSDNKDSEWLIDSGASYYMMYSETWFKNLLNKSKKIMMRIVNK